MISTRPLGVSRPLRPRSGPEPSGRLRLRPPLGLFWRRWPRGSSAVSPRATASALPNWSLSPNFNFNYAVEVVIKNMRSLIHFRLQQVTEERRGEPASTRREACAPYVGRIAQRPARRAATAAHRPIERLWSLRSSGLPTPGTAPGRASIEGRPSASPARHESAVVATIGWRELAVAAPGLLAPATGTLALPTAGARRRVAVHRIIERCFARQFPDRLTPHAGPAATAQPAAAAAAARLSVALIHLHHRAAAHDTAARRTRSRRAAAELRWGTPAAPSATLAMPTMPAPSPAAAAASAPIPAFVTGPARPLEMAARPAVLPPVEGLVDEVLRQLDRRLRSEKLRRGM